MTTELVLLLAIFVFVTAPAFFGADHGPIQTFKKSGPRLGARLEKQLSNGREFKELNGAVTAWQVPPNPPAGKY